jgi:hypothetical protein
MHRLPETVWFVSRGDQSTLPGDSSRPRSNPAAGAEDQRLEQVFRQTTDRNLAWRKLASEKIPSANGCRA